MKFIENIKSSIYNPAYYSEILTKPFSYSLRYFLSLAALAALISTVIFSFVTLPKINKAIGEIVPNILNYYPDDLEVTVKDGKVSTNVQEPYFIKLPADLKDSNTGTEDKPAKEEIENLLVIDTTAPLSLDTFNNYKTFVLLNRDSVIYRESSGSMKIQPLEQGFNGIVTKAKVSSAMDKITPYIKSISYILVPFVFIGLFFGSIFVYLLYLLFGAAVIWLAAKIRNRNLGYGVSYRVGLHAITLGVILEATVFHFFPNLEFTFFFTFIMLAVVWVNLNFASDAGVPLPEPKTDQPKVS